MVPVKSYGMVTGKLERLPVKGKVGVNDESNQRENQIGKAEDQETEASQVCKV